MAHPGALPVINKEAVRAVLRVGAAVGGTLADYTEFDRKNYFYPDLPKGYQISQYEFPLVSGGSLNGIALTRIHLEEDTASSIHDEASGATTVDYNRAGVPLMELVTEPVIHSAEDAGAFARELQLLLRYLGVSDANMERGEMRVEANISVAKEGERGTKVEIKNINSFNFMERAVAYEIERQKKVIAEGGAVVQETRGWDDPRQRTFSQRIKEGSADYRYFPDPDLPSLRLSEIPEFNLDAIRESLPVLPSERRAKYVALGLSAVIADQFVSSTSIADYFDEVVSLNPTDTEYIKRSANYIANDLVKVIRDMGNRDTETEPEIPISARYFAAIIDMTMESKISSRVAKDLLLFSVQEQRDPQLIAEERGLFIATDSAALDTAIRQVLAENQKVVEDYRAGKDAALQYLLGQGMRLLKGAIDPGTLRDSLKKALEA